jgi:serine/threonine-protein kinase RsbW
VSIAVSKDIELTFGSEISYLDLVQGVSDGASALAGFDSDSQYWIGLAVREAVTNAILHGNQEDAKKKVVLVFRICEDRLEIVVRDQGKGMKALDIPDPLDPENLLRPGGRGIFFVRSFMDSVDFRVPPEGGYEMVMEKVRSQRKQGEEDDN